MLAKPIYRRLSSALLPASLPNIAAAAGKTVLARQRQPRTVIATPETPLAAEAQAAVRSQDDIHGKRIASVAVGFRHA